LRNFIYKILTLIIIIIIIACNDIPKSQPINNIAAKPDGCHMCPGQIIIDHHNIKDTILSGSWGNTGIWDTFRYENILYLNIINRYFSGGITESSLKIFKLSHKPHVLIFDTLIMDQKLNLHEILKQELDFKIPNELVIISKTEKFNDNDESSIVINTDTNIFKINYDE
jgi:hypothetical protein